MIVLRRRLIAWLIKAYIKKWKKPFFFFFIFGIACFFFLRLTSGFFLSKIPTSKKETIGIVGAYQADNLPHFILQDISSGLTKIAETGLPNSAIASSWNVSENGKKYTFFLKKNIYFTDGKQFTSDDVNYRFTDVTIKRPGKYTVEFLLKDTYAPFFITVSRPLIKKGFIGVGQYKVKDIKLNGNFVESISLISRKNSADTKNYIFYPTPDALKTAYILGEVSEVIGLSDVSYKGNTFLRYPNTVVKKEINYKKLVTAFYNNRDKVLSDKRIRDALNYSIPQQFPYGKRAFSPFADISWAYDSTIVVERYDIERAKQLIEDSEAASSGALLKLEIKVLPKYENTAKILRKAWREIGVNASLEVVNTLPSQFQIFVGDFNVPKDPDQYALWHSSQVTNITGYDNKRIDKLLEDGRKTVDIEERREIYADFLKYLLPDSPASFLYFPYEYTIFRK